MARNPVLTLRLCQHEDGDPNNCYDSDEFPDLDFPFSIHEDVLRQAFGGIPQWFNVQLCDSSLDNDE